MDALAEGIVGVAEAARGLLLGEPVEEYGAERLVLALQGAGGLLEEAAARGVVHNGWPECEAILGEGPAGQRNPGQGTRPGANAARGPKGPEKWGQQGRGTTPGVRGRSQGGAQGHTGAGRNHLTSSNTRQQETRQKLGQRVR